MAGQGAIVIFWYCAPCFCLLGKTLCADDGIADKQTTWPWRMARMITGNGAIAERMEGASGGNAGCRRPLRNRASDRRQTRFAGPRLRKVQKRTTIMPS